MNEAAGFHLIVGCTCAVAAIKSSQAPFARLISIQLVVLACGPPHLFSAPNTNRLLHLLYCLIWDILI